jgi:hypothetical protein
MARPERHASAPYTAPLGETSRSISSQRSRSLAVGRGCAHGTARQCQAVDLGDEH